MGARNIEDIYRLSSMQQGMLFHTLYAPESGVYFEQSSWILRGDINIPAFEYAWQSVLNRHTALRTGYLWQEVEQPVQVVFREVYLPIYYMDWQNLSETIQEGKFLEFLEEDRRKGFDLTEAPLMRLTLIKTSPGLYYFIWSHHHLLLDGWSQPILFQEVFSIYNAYSQDKEINLEPARQFREYIAWLQEQDIDNARDYWRKILHGFRTPTPVVQAVGKDDIKPYLESEQADYDIVQGVIPEDISLELQEFARQHQITLNTIIQGAWAILLNRYTGERDILFGATVSGRPPEIIGVETIVGLFINTLPVRVQFEASESVLEYLRRIQDKQIKTSQYEYTPLMEIQSWSDIRKDLPLFESLLVFENYPVDEQGIATQQDFSIEKGDVFTRTNYPLTFAVSPGRTVGIEVAYDRMMFDDSTIHRLIDHFEKLLKGVLANPYLHVDSLSILTKREQQTLESWNQTTYDSPVDKCVHRLFEDVVSKNPQAVAVSFDGIEYTYEEINRKANQLAHYMQRIGAGIETVVGISLNPSANVAVAILGVMKAGGAYLPIDPTYPLDRIQYMMEDSGIRFLITEVSLIDELPLNRLDQPPWVIKIDTDWDSRISVIQDSNVEISADPNNLVYVIYTSGSTGLPKGTMLAHRGLSNLQSIFQQYFGVDRSSRILQFASLSFDASIWDMFMAFLCGGTSVFAQRDVLASSSELSKLINEEDVTIMALPPSMLRILPEDEYPTLKKVLSVGEACSKEIVQRYAPQFDFYNGYGPTEVTIATTLYLCEPDSLGVPPIGKPIYNLQTHILNENLNLVPIGVPGELHIGGVGLARGYLNRPDLSAEKFIPDPFSGNLGARLYRTGDLVRYREDGNIEFLGRVDRQVKLRGLRIELGEIESILQQHVSIQSAVVEAMGETPENKQLVAYLVYEEDQVPAVAELRSYLSERLPNFMIPSAFLEIDEIPLTQSGKVDRNSLPALDGFLRSLSDHYVSPRTAIEEIIVGIWEDILDVNRVGIMDNFFELGGHSLKATQLQSRIGTTFNVEFPLRQLFDNPTVAGIANQISQILETKLEFVSVVPPIESILRDEDTGLPVDPPLLSFSQQRLWFLDQLDPGNLSWNIPIFVRVLGPLDIHALEESLNKLVKRHESLRTTFDSIDGKPVQVISVDSKVPFNVKNVRNIIPGDDESGDLLDESLMEMCQVEVQQPFDLVAGPLLNASLFVLNDEEHILIINIHHIIADGWSLSILVHELGFLYIQQTGSRVGAEDVIPEYQPSQEIEFKLPILPIQYADYAVWQRNLLQGELLQQQLDYWRKQLANIPPILDLPTDRPRPALKTSSGSSESILLPGDLGEKLVRLSRREGVTMYMLLLAAFQTLLFRYSSQDDICIGSAIANRTREEFEGLIGFFVNTLVIRGDLSGNPSFLELLERTREVTMSAYAHQDLPFEMLVEELQPERVLSYTPLFQVGFDFQESPVKELNLPDLTLSPIEVHSGTTLYDLLLSVTQFQNPETEYTILSGSLEYNTDLYDRTTIKRMLEHFQMLLNGIASDPDQRIAFLPMLTKDEQNEILIKWNSTSAEFPQTQTIHQRFEHHAKVQPNQIAVTFEKESLTYGELNRKANQLAHYLYERGIGPDILVGISTDRSMDMIVGILGVLKAGGAYIPLDPTYPADRLTFMVEDSEIPILLTQSNLLPNFRTVSDVICLDRDWDAIAIKSDKNLPSISNPNNLAYVIYTSGSTGKPKGAMLKHRGLCNLAKAQCIAFDIDSTKKVLQFSPLSFDASVWETFMALANGGTLCLAKQETLVSGLDLIRLIKEQGITTVTLPPSMLSVISPDQITIDELPELETVIAAGEACTQEIVSRWAGGRRFFNAYGPTETTVCASMKLCNENDTSDPPIGRPIANTRLYVLDKNYQPVPVGVPGELMVGGISLARGYLNRPDMTVDKFIPDPFYSYDDQFDQFLAEEENPRLYRTGDLVRYRTNGDVEFLGRIDHQVKVRGHRIELGEIEAALRIYNDPKRSTLRDSVVIVREDVPGDKRLVAYLTIEQDQISRDLEPPSISELRVALRESLPEYMIPSALIILDQMPLSPAGKVDRISLSKLPSPEVSRQELAVEYVAPRSQIEEGLAEIVALLLGIEKTGEKSSIGIHDNFFELGGHSLLATQFISRIRETFKVELPLRTLFEHPTVAELAMEIEILEKRGDQTPTPTIKRVSRKARRSYRSQIDGNQ